MLFFTWSAVVLFTPTLFAEEPARWVPPANARPLNPNRDSATTSNPLPATSTLRWKSPASEVEAPPPQQVIRQVTLTLSAPENSTSKSPASSPEQQAFRPKSVVAEPERLPERMTKHIGNWNKSKNDQPVKYANHENDPFKDPFSDSSSNVRLTQASSAPGLRSLIRESNDGTAVHSEEPAPIQPAPAPAPRPRSQFQLESPPDFPTDPAAPMPRVTDPAAPMPRTVDPQPMEPAPRDPFPGDMQPMTPQFMPREPMRRPNYEPMSEADTEPSADRCRRIYNDRNCCSTESHCRMANDLLKKMPISKISLDITPRFKLDAPTWSEHDAARDEVLKRSESRKWHDREGNVVAEGRLTDLSHGRAIITTTTGSVERLSLGQLGEDELCFINAWWLLPPECIAASEPFYGRNWTPATFTFTASALCHKPLYFEEVQAERYGHVLGPVLQPIFSGGHFFFNIAVLPYKMGINPPNECQYVLGYYRPGSCAPWMIPPIPLSVRGAALQTGAWVGGIFVIP